MALKTLIFPVIWSICAGCLFTSCESARTATGNVSIPPKEKILTEVEKNRNTFEYFNAKAKVHYNDGRGSYQFSLQIRMESESKMWFQANFLGFEVARILITADSVFYLSRTEKTCYQSTLEGIGRMENVSLNFLLLQNLILGNILLPTHQQPIISFDRRYIRFSNERDSLHTIHLIDPSEFTLLHLQISDLASNHTLSAHFKQYKPIHNTHLFSYFREYITRNSNTYLANIQVTFTNIDISEAKSMPFEIPDDYKITQL